MSDGRLPALTEAGQVDREIAVLAWLPRRPEHIRREVVAW